MGDKIDFCEHQVQGLGFDLEVEIREAFDSILQSPKLFSENKNHIRKYMVNHFPFIIHYSINDKIIRIWAISHSRRKPCYWKTRIN